MSITDDGFVRKTYETRMLEMVEELKKSYPGIDVSETSWLYQMARIAVIREITWQEMIADIMNNMSPVTASGIWLDAHAQRSGIKRRGATKAYGYVWVIDIPVGTTIGTDVEFSTETGVTFSPVEEVEVPVLFEVVYTGGNILELSEEYESDDVTWVARDAGGLSRFTNWSYSDETITFTTDVPTYGSTVFVRTSDTVNVRVYVACNQYGSIGNVPEDLIINYSGISPDSVTNRTATSGGTDDEADASLRSRINRTTNANLSRSNLINAIYDIDNINSVDVLDVTATDVSLPASWDTTPSALHVNDFAAWNTVEQTFSPSESVGFLNSIDIMIAKMTDDPMPMEIDLLSATETLTSTQITRDDLSTQANGFHLLNVPLKYGEIDSSLTYTLKFQTSGFTHWDLMKDTGTGLSVDDVAVGGYSLVFRTRTKVPAVNIIVDPVEGSDFEDIEEEIESIIEYMLPACVDYSITEADIVYISITADISVKNGYVEDDVFADVEEYLRTKFNEFVTGESVSFTEVVGTIISVPGVKRVKNMILYVDDVEVANQTNEYDVTIENYQIPRLGEVDLTRAGS